MLGWQCVKRIHCLLWQYRKQAEKKRSTSKASDRENRPRAGRRFWRARTEGSFGAGILNMLNRIRSGNGNDRIIVNRNGLRKMLRKDSRLIRVKETAVALSGSSDKVRNKGGTAELFALYAERRFCMKGIFIFTHKERK